MSVPGEGARWWGWGSEADRPARLGETAWARLREALGIAGEAAAEGPPPLEDVALSPSRLSEGTRAALATAVGDDHLRDDRAARVSHAAGKGYPDLLRMRAGDASSAPDAVVYPGSREEIADVLAACAAGEVAVVPFGGGTSVVGGVEPLRGPLRAAIALDLRRMDRLVSLDRRSLAAVFEPGATGPRAEAALASRGMTLGHFPQSFEQATIGGFVATRSAGQASTGYGRIDDLVLGLRLVAPVGELEVKAVPASAAGPSLRELVVGSEGVLGVISEVTLSVCPTPSARRYEGWTFRSFEEGVEAFRAMEQRGAAPDVARLSDETETRVSLALASTGSRVERLGTAYLRLRGRAEGCLAILGWEGSPAALDQRRGRAAELLRDAGGLPLGERPGRAWERGRYAAPYLRDDLLDRGVMVETLETATTWSRLLGLHRGVGDALRRTLEAGGARALVMCHVSHLYPSGASLYFTFLAPQERGAELEQWRAAKSAATDAIVAGGGTITHHHAVGRDHAPWMQAEVGDLGLDLLRAAKDRLDPAGIMNPGKLFPPAPGGAPPR